MSERGHAAAARRERAAGREERAAPAAAPDEPYGPDETGKPGGPDEAYGPGGPDESGRSGAGTGTGAGGGTGATPAGSTGDGPDDDIGDIEDDGPRPPRTLPLRTGHVRADLDWADSDADDPDGGSGRTDADDGGYLPGEGTGRPPA